MCEDRWDLRGHRMSGWRPIVDIVDCRHNSHSAPKAACRFGTSTEPESSGSIGRSNTARGDSDSAGRVAGAERLSEAPDEARECLPVRPGFRSGAQPRPHRRQLTLCLQPEFSAAGSRPCSLWALSWSRVRGPAGRRSHGLLPPGPQSAAGPTVPCRATDCGTGVPPVREAPGPRPTVRTKLERGRPLVAFKLLKPPSLSRPHSVADRSACAAAVIACAVPHRRAFALPAFRP
jgi:hypothetical protein